MPFCMAPVRTMSPVAPQWQPPRTSILSGSGALLISASFRSMIGQEAPAPALTWMTTEPSWPAGSLRVMPAALIGPEIDLMLTWRFAVMFEPSRSIRPLARKSFSTAPPSQLTPGGSMQTAVSWAGLRSLSVHGKWISVPGGSQGCGGQLARTIAGIGGMTGSLQPPVCGPHRAVTDPSAEENMTLSPPVKLVVVTLRSPLVSNSSLPPGPPKPPRTAVVTVLVDISSEPVTVMGQSAVVHSICTLLVALFVP